MLSDDHPDAAHRRYAMDLNQSTPILADGAMGTLLYTTLGLTGQPCFEASPSPIRHRRRDSHGYLQAGAQLIKTNPFGASRTRLAPTALRIKCTPTWPPPPGAQAVSPAGARPSSAWGRSARLAPYGRLAPTVEEIAEQVEASSQASTPCCSRPSHLAELSGAAHRPWTDLDRSSPA
jgi:hypothetical protein